jgi:carotenoid cleavage dioxygenase-like enzyme
MIHAVELRGGKAAYRNRWIETAGLRAERRAGRAFYGSLRAPFPPDRRLVGDDGDPSPVKNVANTNVIAHAQRILALYEGGLPYELDAALRTKGTFDFGGDAGPTMTAHPKRDPRDGSLHFFSYGLEPPYLTYYEADAAGTVVRKQSLELANLTVVHDCLLTERSFVLVIPPLFLALARVMRGKPLMRWEPERGAQIVIIDRADRAKEPQRVTLEPFFFWHFLNGFEEGDELTIDLIAHASLEASIRSDTPASSLVRLHVDRRARSASLERRDDRFIEFPRRGGRGPPLSVRVRRRLRLHGNARRAARSHVRCARALRHAHRRLRRALVRPGRLPGRTRDRTESRRS